jgi:hypothetical protein
LRNSPANHFETADSVKLNRFEARISYRHRIARNFIPNLQLMPSLRAFTDTHQKFSGLTSYSAGYSERISQITVGALVERATQSNSRLHGGHAALPSDLVASMTL